jgi:hypothetical protein
MTQAIDTSYIQNFQESFADITFKIILTIFKYFS